MDEKAIRRRCEARLRELSLPTPFDLDIFIVGIATRRSRPIVRYALPLMGGLPGLWIETDTADLLYYEERTSPLHQQHIILHELGHILLGHRGVHLVDIGDLTLTDLRALRADHYTRGEEHEAETLATLIGHRVQRAQAGLAVDADPYTTRILRLLDSLEGTAYE
jgi:hypothetical protein